VHYSAFTPSSYIKRTPTFSIDVEYRALCCHVLYSGVPTLARTQQNTTSIFGAQISYDCRNGFPLITTKRVFWKGVKEELLWFLSGQCHNVEALQKKGVHIWDAWASEDGNLGFIYGVQWKAWPLLREEGFVDQIAVVMDEIRNNPDSRRMIVSAWNVAQLEEMALPPCHMSFQFSVNYPQPTRLKEHVLYRHMKKEGPRPRMRDWVKEHPARLKAWETLCESSTNNRIDPLQWRDIVAESKKAFGPEFENLFGPFLDIRVNQRSADLFYGVPFNLASYGLLLHMVAECTGLTPRGLIFQYGDVHIYDDQRTCVATQADRKPFAPPTLQFTPHKTFQNLSDFSSNDILLRGYNSHPPIKGPPVAV